MIGGSFSPPNPGTAGRAAITQSAARHLSRVPVVIGARFQAVRRVGGGGHFDSAAGPAAGEGRHHFALACGGTDRGRMGSHLVCFLPEMRLRVVISRRAPCLGRTSIGLQRDVRQDALQDFAKSLKTSGSLAARHGHQLGGIHVSILGKAGPTEGNEDARRCRSTIPSLRGPTRTRRQQGFVVAAGGNPVRPDLLAGQENLLRRGQAHRCGHAGCDAGQGRRVAGAGGRATGEDQ